MRARYLIRGLAVFLFVAFAAATVPCLALQDYEKSLAIRSGDKVNVLYHFNCDGSVVDAEIDQAPSHGKVEFLRTTLHPNRFKERCLTTDDSVQGTEVWYSSVAGFVGDDQFKVVRWAGQAQSRQRSFDTIHIHIVSLDATPWLPNQRELQPRPTLSTLIAKLPLDTAITPPGPDVPPALARLSGRWSGSLCGDQLSVKVAVERVTAAGGTIVYANANSFNNVILAATRAEATVGAPDELRAHIDTLELVIRARTDGNADFWFQRKSVGHECSGVLAREGS